MGCEPINNRRNAAINSRLTNFSHKFRIKRLRVGVGHEKIRKNELNKRAASPNVLQDAQHRAKRSAKRGIDDGQLAFLCVEAARGDIALSPHWICAIEMSIKPSLRVRSRFLGESRFHNSSELMAIDGWPESTQIYGVEAASKHICNSDRISSLLLSIIHVRQRVFGLFSLLIAAPAATRLSRHCSPNHPSAKPCRRGVVCTLCSTREIISVISRKLPESIAAKGANRRWKLRSLKFARRSARLGFGIRARSRQQGTGINFERNQIEGESSTAETICGRTDAEQMEIKIRAADKRAETNERAHPRPLATGNRVRNKFAEIAKLNPTPRVMGGLRTCTAVPGLLSVLLTRCR